MSQPSNVSIRPAQIKHPVLATKFSWSDPDQRNPAILLGILCLALGIAYWNMLSFTSAAWADPLYSHGYLLPLFALGIFLDSQATVSVDTSKRTLDWCWYFDSGFARAGFCRLYRYGTSGPFEFHCGSCSAYF